MTITRHADGMTHSRPSGMSETEKMKTRKRLAGQVLPNASGANQSAPPILAGSEPSRAPSAPQLTPEEIAAVAEHNRRNREQVKMLEEDPVNGTHPDDVVHDEATAEPAGEVVDPAQVPEPLLD